MNPQDLVAWRRRWFYTQDDAAKYLGISKRTIASWENGDSAIPRSVELACVHADKSRAAVPYWRLSKQDQKHEIEAALTELFADAEQLSARQRVFMAEAIEATQRGLFGLAMQCVLDTFRPDEDFAPDDPLPLDADYWTIDQLRRALAHLRALPPRERPAFR